MKKTISLVLAATIVAVVGTALLSSCEKEEITAIPTSDVQEKSNITPMEQWLHGIFPHLEDVSDFMEVAYCRGKQDKIDIYFVENGIPKNATKYDCIFDELYPLCRIECDWEPYGPDYSGGDVMGVLCNGKEDPGQLYYVFDTLELHDEGISLGNVLELEYDIPIKNSYHLDIAPENTTLLIPAGNYDLTHCGGGIYFSVNVENLIWDTDMVIFE